MSQNSPEFHRPVKKSQLCAVLYSSSYERQPVRLRAFQTTRPAARAARVATSEFVTSPSTVTLKGSVMFMATF